MTTTADDFLPELRPEKRPPLFDVCTAHLFATDEEIKEAGLTPVVVRQLKRIREMYTWTLSHPEATDRTFLEEHTQRFNMSRPMAVADLRIIHQLMPALASAQRDWHRWRANEMLLAAYKVAKEKGDAKTMERVATSYAKINRVDLEDEQQMPLEMILVQPFTATSDPTVLGIKPIPNINEKINSLISKYRAETIDIDDVDFEEADLEEQILFPESQAKAPSDGE